MKRHLLRFVLIPVLLLMGMTAITFVKVSGAHAHPACDEGWVYDSIVAVSTHDQGLAAPVEVQNDGDTDQTYTRTFKMSGKLSVQLTAGMDFSFAQGAIKASTGVTIQAEVSVEETDQLQGVVPAHKNYVFQPVIQSTTYSGHYYYRMTDCSVGTDKGYVETTGPLFWVLRTTPYNG